MQLSGLFRGNPRTRRSGGLFIAAALPFVFRVREQDATMIDADSAAPPIAENERVEKRWRLEQSQTAALNHVQLNLPGLTYVSYDDSNAESDTMATIRVTGDSPEIVECVDVVPLPPNGVELRWKSKACAQVRGHLLTSLTLAREGHVNELRARGSGTVVIEDGVLVADCEHASVTIAAEGAGDLFVTSQQRDLHLRSLSLSMIGTGTLQFVGANRMMLRDPFLLEAAGAAKLRFFGGRIDTSFLRSSIAGSGKIELVSSGGLHVDKIKTNILGDGEVVYDGEGECRVQRCTIVGSGKVVSRDILSKEGSIEAYGEADVTLNVSGTLQASGWSSTTARYVGDKPEAVEGKSISLKAAPPVSPGTTRVNQAINSPRKEAAFEEIRAVYNSKLDAFETNTTGLGKAMRYLVCVCSDDEESHDVEKETKKHGTDAPSKK